ncbi:MAG: sugar phosphate isomerase/epimerase [Caulobacteraceae bacterium]|nr:sugar phosphate isomerase/epimerase [Caulobacteraceae bacterium]
MPRRLDPNLVVWTAALPGRGFAETVAAAAASGHGAISLARRFVMRAMRKERLSAEQMRAILAEAGVRVACVESCSAWYGGAVSEDGGEPVTTAEMIALARTFGAPLMAASSAEHAERPIGEVVQAFAELCREAADSGVAVALEPVAMWTLKDTGLALEIVERADAPNGGLLLDTWHHARSSSRDEVLDRIPPELVYAVQLADAPAAPEPDIKDECFHRRRMPGDGDLDLAGFLRRIGAGARAPIGVETWTSELARQDVGAVAEAFARATDEVRAAART